MENKEFDFVVIGGGSAGYAAARSASSAGLSTAVIDGADRLGGLCILRGCMPSKTLIESANRFRTIRRAKEFGLRAEKVSVHEDEIVARQRSLINEFAEYRQGQLTDGRFTLIRGTAKFLDSHSLRVSLRDGGEETIRFHTCCIATGSAINHIPIPGLEKAGYWTSDDLLEAGSVPDSVIVLGGGAVALEMACYLEGIGKKVTVIQRSEHLLSGIDHDVADALAEAMRSRGIEIYTGTTICTVETGDDGLKTVCFNQHNERREVSAPQILQALGRTPQTKGLDLEAAGVKLNGKSIETTSTMSTTAPHIFAAGDVCGPMEVVHTAVEQGEIAAHNAALKLGKAKGGNEDAVPRQIEYRLKLLAIFTDPQAATIGLSELEALEGGLDIISATYPFDDHGKSMVMGETDGFVKMIADRQTREILGASVVGPGAVELIHEMSVAMHFRISATEFLRIPHYHPTLSEIWTYPAEEIAEY